MTFHDILAWIGLALAAVVMFDGVTTYTRSTSTGSARWLDVGRGSATMLWQQFGLMIAGTVAGMDKIVDFVTGLAGDTAADAAIKSAIGSWFTPTTAAIALAAYASITVAARMRTMGRK